ncbi:MAG: family 20 glycosylhydrolase, partial [Eubacteriales bacterium]|nr:family 20 glycosylhydrolase [Eubacteriales bacterium]
WCIQYDGRVSEYLYVPIKEYPKLRTPVVTRYFSPSEGWKDYESLPPMFEEDFFGELAAYGAEKAVTVLPLFNSYGHNTLIPAQYPEVSALEEDGQPSKTGFCTSNPKTYELLFAIYDSIIDRHLKPNGIDSFHIGLDEVWDGIALNAEDIYHTRSTRCRCAECKKKTLNALYIDHAVKLIEHLKNRGMKNIYMYNDMLKFAENAGAPDSPARTIAALLCEKELDKVTILDCWTYSETYDGLSFKSTLPELGLRRTVKPWNGYYHWTILSHPLNNIYMMAKMAYDDDAEGMQSYSAWDDSYRRNHTAQASFAWNFKGSGSTDDFRRSFAGEFSGGDTDTAQRAFEALEACASYNDGKYGFMLHLSYYFYSYVRPGVPYPRRFPGEAVENLLKTRAPAEKMTAEIEASALEAVSLFERLGSNTSADYVLAVRYAYEAENYLCLVRDYRTLLRMHDLSSSLPDDGVINEIRSLAKERKEARLTLMALLEKTKEHYLMASHMRNHTIFMQYFADLEGYLTYTAPESVKLDFTDNTHFASDAFMCLR